MATLASFTLQFKPYFEPILLDLLQTCSAAQMLGFLGKRTFIYLLYKSDSEVSNESKYQILND